MIRAEQLQELRDAIAKDEATVAELRIKRFVGAGAAYAAAKGRIELATDALADLTAQYEAEQAVIADRPNREKAEAKYLDSAARALVKADDRITTALNAAQAALMELVEATRARGDLVAETHAEMAARGFTLREHEGQPPYETGTEKRLDGPVVRIRGRWWKPLAPLHVVDWVKHRVVAARLPEQKPSFCVLCRGVEGREDSVTAGVKALPEVPRPAPPARRAGPIKGAPVYLNLSVQDYERKIDEEELRWTKELFADADGRTQSRRVEPTEAMKAAAAHRKALLHQGIADGHIHVRG